MTQYSTTKHTTPTLAHGDSPTGTEGFNLSDVLAQCAQQAFGAARRSNIALLYDYRGDAPRICGSPQRVRSIANHLLAWSVRSAKGHGICFRAEVRRMDGNRCLLELRAADADVSAIDASLPRAWESEPPLDQNAVSLLSLAGSLCTGGGGRLAVRCLEDAGTEVSARLCLPILEGADNVTQNAVPEGTLAWLIGNPPKLLEPLAKRLRRNGWAVRLFATSRDALEEVEGTTAVIAPSLLVGAEPYGVNAADFLAVQRALRHPSTTAWLVEAGRRGRKATQGTVETYAMPVGESVLAQFARRAHPDRRAANDDQSLLKAGP